MLLVSLDNSQEVVLRPSGWFSRKAMQEFLCGILMILLSCASEPALTGRAARDFSPLLPYTMKKLSNGLTVIVKEVHTSPIVAVHFWCKTGSVNEEGFPAGISHFFEHMFFKGTEKMGVGEMDRIVKSLGGYNNAFTSKEYTGYYIVVPSENFSVAFDILLDAIRNSVFDPEEIERERAVIYEEINRSEDLPESCLLYTSPSPRDLSTSRMPSSA